MAIIALVIGGDMVECFPGRLDAIVAADATAGDRRVIHESNDGPVRGDMTIGTLTGSHYMVRWL